MQRSIEWKDSVELRGGGGGERKEKELWMIVKTNKLRFHFFLCKEEKENSRVSLCRSLEEKKMLVNCNVWGVLSPPPPFSVPKIEKCTNGFLCFVVSRRRCGSILNSLVLSINCSDMTTKIPILPYPTPPSPLLSPPTAGNPDSMRFPAAAAQPETEIKDYRDISPIGGNGDHQ